MEIAGDPRLAFPVRSFSEHPDKRWVGECQWHRLGQGIQDTHWIQIATLSIQNLVRIPEGHVRPLRSG